MFKYFNPSIYAVSVKVEEVEFEDHSQSNSLGQKSPIVRQESKADFNTNTLSNFSDVNFATTQGDQIGNVKNIMRND